MRKERNMSLDLLRIISMLMVDGSTASPTEVYMKH